MFDDFAWLFLPEQRAGVPALTIWAAEQAFRSIFRLTVQEFSFVLKHTRTMIQRRQDRRGRKPISIELTIAAALFYLAHGATYKNDSYFHSKWLVGGNSHL